MVRFFMVIIMAKIGRPQKQINKRDFEKLCELQCTKEDIANWFEVSEDTIDRFCKREYGVSFAVVFKQKRTKGTVSLRKAGFDMAKNNPSVHIFYAKNFLHMTDRQDIRTEITTAEQMEKHAQYIKDVLLSENECKEE